MSAATAEPEAFQPPNYDGGSIVNLMASIVAADGGQAKYPLLIGLPMEKLTAARHVVLIVIDGLGYDYLRRSNASFLCAHLQGSMMSVFPPTTATAVTSYLTGLAPRQHGLTGWFTYFEELGAIVTVLPFMTRLGAVPLARLGVSAKSLLGHDPVFDALARPSCSIAPARIAHSEFNTSHLGRAVNRPYESMADFFSTIEAAVKGVGESSFCYAYWPELDALSHANGVGSESVAQHLNELDAGMAELTNALAGTDTLLVVTADHGFVDIASDRFISAQDHPALLETLRVPLCGEPRTAYCYVAPERQSAFLDYVGSELVDCAVCVESSTLIERGFFGPGPDHRRLRSRIGDFTLQLREGYGIHQALPGEEPPHIIGMHGGASRAELDVPLVIMEV